MNVYLVADSGSTKTEWILFSKEKMLDSFATSGFNSDINPGEEIREMLYRELSARAVSPSPVSVFMYAASMANHNNVILLRGILSEIFQNVQVEVEHDLLGAARAACQHEPGIACILGTGSNSCLYDGKNIVKEIGGQGYLFGDEGSGADLGKALLTRMLNGYFSPELVKEICEWKNLSPHGIRKEAYQSGKPNVYLSQFSKFISANLHQPEIRQMVKDRMTAFLKETVTRYEGYESLPANFVGSVAETYREILLEACAGMKVRAGRFIKHPAEALMQYHQSGIES